MFPGNIYRGITELLTWLHFEELKLQNLLSASFYMQVSWIQHTSSSCCLLAVASIWNGCWFHHCYPSILPVVGMDRQIETERWWVSGGGLQCPGKPFCYPWWWRLIKIWPPVFMLTVEGGVFPTSALQTLHLYALQKCRLHCNDLVALCWTQCNSLTVTTECIDYANQLIKGFVGSIDLESTGQAKAMPHSI